MKLKRVVSGGQTGVDQTALELAIAMGFETGGWAPRGYRTNVGPNPSLGTVFGLKTTESGGYRTRTRLNVRDSDVTVWFGNHSPGYYCTAQAAEDYAKEFVINPSAELLRGVFDTYETVNFAGNRMESNPNASGLLLTTWNEVFGGGVPIND